MPSRLEIRYRCLHKFDCCHRRGSKVLNKRIKRALELRRKGLSFVKIGQDLGIGSEQARQIVRKYPRHLKFIEDPFALKIKDTAASSIWPAPWAR